MLLWLVLTGAAAGAGFVWTRNFVRRRLRFVDMAHRPATPIVAGVAVAAVAAPIMGLLPVVTAASAVAVGAGVGLGWSKGAKDR